jgi:large subunit ribosomal protein L5
MSLKDKYIKEVIPKVKAELGFKNDLQVPRLERIVVNVGIGKIAEQEPQIAKVVEDLRKITGQAPAFAIAKKAISGFKVKQGDKVGVKVTLRGKRMWEFLERMIVAALPRIKDFSGIPITNFSDTGDCSVGIREHIVFPEINPDETNFVFGLQVNIVTTARTREEGMAVLKALGFPVQHN